MSRSNARGFTRHQAIRYTMAFITCCLLAGFIFPENSTRIPGAIAHNKPWSMHQLDARPLSGSDGVKLADVNSDGLPDLVTGFEEGAVSRIYIHPGKDRVKQHWDFVSLPSPNVEDAVLVDLDDDGSLDLVTASEGKGNRIVFHWAPPRAGDYLDSSKWQMDVVPSVDGLSAWMFIVPWDMDGKNGIDLIIGSKRKAGEEGEDRAWVGWLKSPRDPRNASAWEFFPLTKAGWIMSIVNADMNGDGDMDLLISDRKFSSETGVRWLENPGRHVKEFYQEWKSHTIGVNDGEPMFLDHADLNADGTKEIIVPDCYGGLKILEQQSHPALPWKIHTISYPAWAGPRGKAVSVGDIDLDGKSDIVLSFEEEGNVARIPYETYAKNGRYSVVWGAYQSDPLSADWTFTKVSGLRGRKFDLVNLIDMDLDGDLDVLTNDENEEGDGLGVVWFENSLKGKKVER